MDVATLDSLRIAPDPAGQPGVAVALMLVMFSVALGMIVAAWAPDVAMRIRKHTSLIGVSVLIGVVVYGLVYFSPILLPALALLGGIVVIHNAVAFTTGAAAGFLLSPKPATRRALTFELGIQNSGLALVILLGQLKGVGGAAAVAAVWGVWHLIAGGAVATMFWFVDRSAKPGYDVGRA